VLARLAQRWKQPSHTFALERASRPEKYLCSDARSILVIVSLPPGLGRIHIPRASGAAGLMDATSNCSLFPSWKINTSNATNARKVYIWKIDA
jgi:hypothetical protein